MSKVKSRRGQSSLCGVGDIAHRPSALARWQNVPTGRRQFPTSLSASPHVPSATRLRSSSEVAGPIQPRRGTGSISVATRRQHRGHKNQREHAAPGATPGQDSAQHKRTGDQPRQTALRDRPHCRVQCVRDQPRGHRHGAAGSPIVGISHEGPCSRVGPQAAQTAAHPSGGRRAIDGTDGARFRTNGQAQLSARLRQTVASFAGARHGAPRSRNMSKSVRA